MKSSILKFTGFVALVLSMGSAAVNAASVNLITNGTFDAGLSGWTQGGTIGTFWDAATQTAHVGRPGTPGTSTFSQTFLAPTSGQVSVSFDYQWQINSPSVPDVFSVIIDYTSGGSAVQTVGFVQSSDAVGAFNTNYLTDFLVSGMDAATNATITFQLDENNSPVGTRIQLDNVEVSAVPLPAAAWLFGSALLGLVTVARRRRAAA